MKKISFSILALAAAAVVTTGCFDLEEKAYSEIVQKDFVPTDQDVAALLASSYSEFGAMMDWYGMFDAQEEAADVVITPARPNGWVDGGVYQRMHEHTWNADDPGSPASLYGYCFSGINAANRVLDQVKDGSLPCGELEDEVINELKAVRALWYAVLLDSHGNVPIVTSYVDYNEANPLKEGEEDKGPKQSSRARVYKFVTSQLQQIIDADVLSKEKTAALYGRLNMWGVKMALMRVYLNAEVYVGERHYQEALDLAEDIINNGPYSLSATYAEMFTPDVSYTNPEVIFAIPYDNTYYTGQHVFSMGMKFYPPSEGRDHFGYSFSTWGGNCGNPQFIKSYDPEDKRLEDTWLHGPQMKKSNPEEIAWWALNYLPSITGNGGGEENPLTSIDFGCRQNKFKADVDAPRGNQWSNDFPWFRLAEAYYTAAECILRGSASKYGKTASEYVNAVRSRSVATPLSDADLKVTTSRVQYGLCTFGDCTSAMRNIHEKALMLDNSGNWVSDPERKLHDWSDVAEALEASQIPQPSGHDNDAIQLAGMYDEWGYEFALEGLRRQQMIRFGTFSSRNWFNHTAIGDTHTALFPIDKGTQNDNENIGQNPGYASANGEYAENVAINDPLPDNL
ncbi:MAG: RagB/SusD family nutrient uptake outer membrane protein [Candidatus Cryptobacteroides sp.]